MKNIKYTIVILIIITALFSLAYSQANRHNQQVLPDNRIVTAVNSFAFDIFHELCAEDTTNNIFISPFSISYALGMTYNGAVDETKQEMHEVLRYGDMDIDAINQAYMKLMDYILNLDPKVKMIIANSIWTRLGFPIKEEFLNLNHDVFNAEVQNLNFDSPEAARIINDWVAKNTENKITRIVPDQIDPSMIMYLINAIYFKADWRYSFEERQTREEFFYLKDSTPYKWKMMNQRTDFPAIETDIYEAVSLPYGDGKFSMLVVKPKDSIGINQFISGFHTDNWEQSRYLPPREVILKMPRYKMRYAKSLNNNLMNMGMKYAFIDTAAQFDKMSDSQLHIDQVLHKSFVQVDEEGTEAAAVTSVSMGGIECVSVRPSPLVIKIDRPFIFAIYENRTGAILFMGRIMKPVWED